MDTGWDIHGRETKETITINNKGDIPLLFLTQVIQKGVNKREGCEEWIAIEFGYTDDQRWTCGGYTLKWRMLLIRNNGLVLAYGFDQA